MSLNSHHNAVICQYTPPSLKPNQKKKKRCVVLECQLSSLYEWTKKSLVASVIPVFLFCPYIKSTFPLFFFPEINGELMIPLFPRCARKGWWWWGPRDSFLIAQPLKTDWSRKNTPPPSPPSARSHNGGADFFFLIGFYAVRRPAGIRSGLIILNKAKPLGLSVCLLFAMLSQWSVCSQTTSKQSKNTISS